MNGSEILLEKHRVQKQLATESTSVQNYLVRSHFAAEQIASSNGLRLRYAELPNRKRLKELKIKEN